jgi:hypothetical protein
VRDAIAHLPERQRLVLFLRYFVRSPVISEIRRSLRRGGEAPSADVIAGRVGRRVVALDRRDQLPPAGTVGFWSDGDQIIEAVEQAPGGRRLFVRLRAGRIAWHNLHALAFVF